MKRRKLTARRMASALAASWMLCLSVPAVAGPSAPPTAPAAVEDARKVLEDAFNKAKSEGKPVSVDLDLDLKEIPGRVQKGDLVEVHYTARDEEGRIVRTTRREISVDREVAKVEGYEEPGDFDPEQVVGGAAHSPFSLGELILGMEAGQKTSATVPPERAYGASDPRKRLEFPCVRTMPKAVRLSAHEYTSRYQAFPKLGREVDWTPYFKARILEITDADVALELLAADGERIEEELGVVEIGVTENEVTISLTPRIGAPFTMQDRQGKIVSTDGRSFTVDFNPPMAGKTVVLEFEIVSLVKASGLKDKEIHWMEDHDQGLEAGRSQGKPVVLVLYADWCNYCKRLFEETLVDPRIKAVGDGYVWVRVNSDKDKRIHQLYEQNGFPLIVLLDGKGRIAKKIDGYRDAGTLRRELSALGRAT